MVSQYAKQCTHVGWRKCNDFQMPKKAESENQVKLTFLGSSLYSRIQVSNY